MMSDPVRVILWEASNPSSKCHYNTLTSAYEVIQDRSFIQGKEERVVGIVTHTSPTQLYDSNFLNKFKNLEFVATPSTATTHINLEGVSNKIKLLTVAGRPIMKKVTSSSEHALFLVLASYRNIKLLNEAVTSGSWRENETIFRATQVASSKFGVVGLGRIGNNVAKILKAMGADVLYFDTRHKPNSEFHKVGLQYLFSTCDTILLSCELNSASRNLIDAEILKFANNLRLVNVSRGEVVDEAAIIQFLNGNHLKSYATDVLSDEQHGVQHSKLWQESLTRSDIFITPHSAGLSYESEDITIGDIVAQITGFERI